MHANVDIIEALGVAEVFLEVLHVRNEQGLVALEVLVHFLVFIAHMNDYLRAWRSIAVGQRCLVAQSRQATTHATVESEKNR